MPQPSLNTRNQDFSAPTPARPSAQPQASTPAASNGHLQNAAPPVHSAAQAISRDNGGKERRERLYAAVRSAMSDDAVGPADYRVKALALDSSGSRFLVVMDVPASFAGGAKRLSRLEGLIARAAKKRLNVTVTGVYWRMDPHALVAVPVPTPASTPASTSDVATAATAVKAASPGPAPATGLGSRVAAFLPGWAASARPAGARKRGIFAPIEADELAAFRRAKGAAGGERAADSKY